MPWHNPEAAAEYYHRAATELVDVVAKVSSELAPELAAVLAERLEKAGLDDEALTAQVLAWTRASMIASVPTKLPTGYVISDWAPFGDLPVWRVELPHEREAARQFDDYVPPPPDTDVVIYLDEYSDDQLTLIRERALALAESFGYEDFKLVEHEHGSIWEALRGKIKDGANSDFVQQKMQELDQRISLEMLGKAQAEVDAIRTANTAA